MPSKSKKQARMMRASCKSDSFRGKVGIPKKVACEYMHADQMHAGKKKPSSKSK